ncbi:MAG: hypothetical protein WCI43_09005 [Candidatus Firestonebacteria bacterium]
MKKALVVAAFVFVSAFVFAGQFKHNFAWDWTMPHDAKFFDEVKRLGFNNFVTSEAGATLDKIFEEAGKRDIKVYLVMGFKAGGVFPDGSEQSISAADTKNVIRKAKLGKDPNDQVGGEPLDPNDVNRDDFVCFNNADALKAGVENIRNLAAEKRAAGIAFDWFGFKNYYACFCDNCVEKEAVYAKAHPELKEEEALYKFSEESLLNFMNTLIAEGRKARPDIKFTCHVYPYFKPEPLYGNKLNIEYPEQTVSWFFLPHWDLKKVRDYTKIVVKGAKKYYKDGVGIPFMGISSDKNMKSAARIADEFKILTEEGAEGVSVACIGDILKDPEMAKVFEEKLK